MKEFIKAILYKPLFNLLVFFAYIVPGHSIGWAIIILTLLVRVLLWKPSAKTLLAPLQMREHRDDLQALQEKHKNDRTALAQAQIAFYKEKGINPLAGCLPLLIQLPIILILYRVFIVGINDIRPDLIYSFTPHLNTINSFFLGIDLAKADPTFILPILAAVAQYFQTRHMQAINPPMVGSDPAAMMARQMILILPVMTFFIAYKLPAGLALYWVTTTLFSWAQQIYIAKSFKPTAKATVTVRSKKK